MYNVTLNRYTKLYTKNRLGRNETCYLERKKHMKIVISGVDKTMALDFIVTKTNL